MCFQEEMHLRENHSSVGVKVLLRVELRFMAPHVPWTSREHRWETSETNEMAKLKCY